MNRHNLNTLSITNMPEVLRRTSVFNGLTAMMRSPELMPMTPAFGPMNTTQFAAPTSSYPSNVGYSSASGAGSYPMTGAARDFVVGSNQVLNFTDRAESYMANPYGTMLQPKFDDRPLIAEVHAQSGAFPQTISIPHNNLRIISSQVRPIQPYQVQQASSNINMNQKYSTQMSARVKYLGEPLKTDIMRPLPQPANYQTAVISVGPTATLPLAAASAAMTADQPKEMQYMRPGTKVLAEYYYDRKWYPATVVSYDNSAAQYTIKWDDGDIKDTKKLPTQIVKKGGCTIS